MERGFASHSGPRENEGPTIPYLEQKVSKYRKGRWRLQERQDRQGPGCRGGCR